MVTSDPNTQGIEELGRRFVTALHALESEGTDALDHMIDLFAADAVLTNAALRRAGEQRSGDDGIRRFWTEYASTFRGARTEFRALTCSTREVGLFWTTRAADPDGGERRYDGATLLAYDASGDITLFSGYYDPADLQLAQHAAQTPIRAQDPQAAGQLAS